MALCGGIMFRQISVGYAVMLRDFGETQRVYEST